MMSQFFTTEISSYENLEFITVKSNALKKRADITIFNPSKNDKFAKSIPIVILLHGVYGSHWAWALKGKVHQTAQRLISEEKIKPMVLVMPSDGLYGDGSAYVPHKTENYEKWIVEDVIEVLKEQIPQVDESSAVFVAGLSMGGFGALRLGAKYPKVFKAFSGLSSITHFDQLKLFVSDFDSLKDNALEKDGVIDWMIKNKKDLPPFRFDCGSEDLLIEQNRKLHSELLENNIEHIYKENSGAHQWEYWTEHIVETLQFFSSKL
jgi:enterochelin esterase-like enzyme